MSPSGRPRDWFLRRSHWHDAHWILAATSALHADRPVILRWDFVLPNGLRLTDARYGPLLESARQHLALYRTGSTRARGSRTGSTVRIYFQALRVLIRWMIGERLERFSEIDAAHIAEFSRIVRRRRGYAGPLISPVALSHYYGLLVDLYRDRRTVEDSIQIDPFPGLSAATATPWGNYATKPGLYTPDEVAIPLIQGAIEFLSSSALPALAARERYTQAYARIRALNMDAHRARTAALTSLAGICINTPRGAISLGDRRSLCQLIDLIYAACFVVISYLVGLRVSELMSLKAGCIQPLDELASQDPAAMAAIVGAIYKGESYHGRAHRWVAPPPAIHAVTVLEALSASHRSHSGREDLWQRPRVRYFGLSEWLPQDSKMVMRISDTRSANARINRLARWLQIPRYKGRRWWFTSHQGRRTFARFVALRDGTALYALAQHLGHRNVRQTDGAYAGRDYELDREIDAEVLEQSIDAWEQMLSSKQLGGRMGADVLARRPRFRGGRIKQAIRSYARMLAESGLTLGVCEWGYCVYREEFSACRGTPSAPNPIRREPSTCARCKNFCLSDAHRPYWTEQLGRYRQILNDPELPAQTLKIARARLGEAQALLKVLDSR